MTVKEFIGTLESSDRLRIIEGKAEVYVGYLAAFKPFADHEISEEYRKYSGHEVKKFRAVPEITHRRWKELGLMKPLEPDQTAQYKFTLYCKAEFGFNNNAEQFRKSYDALKMRLALSVEYNTAPEVSETDTDGAESEV